MHIELTFEELAQKLAGHPDPRMPLRSDPSMVFSDYTVLSTPGHTFYLPNVLSGTSCGLTADEVETMLSCMGWEQVWKEVVCQATPDVVDRNPSRRMSA